MARCAGRLGWVGVVVGGVWLAAGCGDNLPGSAPPTGEYRVPADFPTDGCEGGAVALDPTLIAHGRLTYTDFTASIAARLDGDASGMLVGSPAEVTYREADGVVLRAPLANNGLRALYLCGADGDALVGHYVRCREDACTPATFRGSVVRRLDEPAAVGLTEVGAYYGAGWSAGLSVNVRVADDIAYVARYQDGLRIVDVSDPAAPIELAHVPIEYPETPEIWNDVKLLEVGGARYALMASSVVGLVIVDVTDPTSPAIVAHALDLSGGVENVETHTLALVGTTAFLGNTDRGLEIFDLSDPTAPVKRGQWQHPSGEGFLHDLYVSPTRAYLNYWNQGMVVLDHTQPSLPVLGAFVDYGSTTSHSSWVGEVGGRQLALHGDEEYGAGLHLVDVSEGTPEFLTSQAFWQTREEVSIHNVMMVGNEAFIAYYQDGVRILDVSTPSAPVPQAHFNTWPGYDPTYGESFFEGAVGIDVRADGRRIWVADSHRGLIVLDRP